MEKIQYAGYDCVRLTNASLELIVTISSGPRILSLRLGEGENLFAELPNACELLPNGERFNFIGGHRLWIAPEQMPETYEPDNDPVSAEEIPNGIRLSQQVGKLSGLQKGITIRLLQDQPRVMVEHTIKNAGSKPADCAPWAITQLNPGGIAILPQNRIDTKYLSNRSLVFWPYTDMSNPFVFYGNRCILINAEMNEPYKIGFPNPRGWLAYWQNGTLFSKQANYDPQTEYYDFNSSSECYCCQDFLELETLGPISNLAPGQTASHTETWSVHSEVEIPEDEDAADRIVKSTGLE